jgi:UDP-2-acetamido-3-amino-2,3-dideoxy-glucuronate N-acetyltransferase
VTLADGVFVAPGVVFTNDRYPRSPRLPDVIDRYAGRDWLLPTAIGKAATLGAGAIILAGVSVGEFAFVAAGALVVADVPPYGLAAGHPASLVGWVCSCGRRLRFEQEDVTCAFCGSRFRLQGDSVVPHGT